jgi:HK97 family phage prohead protease
MTIHMTLAEAAIVRADGGRYDSAAARPSERRAAEPSDSSVGVRVQLRAESVTRSKNDAGDEIATVVGFASVTEQGYEMYDWAGPYTEVVSLDAFDTTLGADPLVEFTLNHNRGGGLPMAHTRNGTLALSVVKEGDTTGLWYEAQVDTSRGDVSDMVKALERGDLAEASFKFRIVRGQWSPDYMEFRINETDLNRGDVSAVNFGANPLATSTLRGEAGPELVTPDDAGRPVRFDDDDLIVRRARPL